MHIAVVGLTDDNANSTKCLLDTFKGHIKPRSEEIVAASAYKQLGQGDLGLPEYIEKCSKSKMHAIFGIAYDKCL